MVPGEPRASPCAAAPLSAAPLSPPRPVPVRAALSGAGGAMTPKKPGPGPTSSTGPGPASPGSRRPARNFRPSDHASSRPPRAHSPSRGPQAGRAPDGDPCRRAARRQSRQYVLAPSDACKVRLRRGGRRRARPQPALARRVAYPQRQGGPSGTRSLLAEDALEASLQETAYQRLREWRSGRRSFPTDWLTSAFSTFGLTYMTAKEMKLLSDEIVALLTRYDSRVLDKADRPPDALPVHIFAFGHPLPPTPSGN